MKPLPGTTLKTIFSRFGFEESASCRCKRLRKKMDKWGPEKCRERIDYIVEIIYKEAHSRSIPTTKFIVKRIVNYAIRKSERVAK